MAGNILHAFFLMLAVFCCQSYANKRAVQTTKINALSRPMQLGMLYDRRTDQIVPGKTLWTQTQLKNRTIKSQDSTSYTVEAERGIEQRANLLDVSAELSLSFMAGKLSITGSAKFLQDSKRSSKVSRVFARYKQLTKFEQLNMDHLARDNIHYQEVFDQNLATDVIVGIHYGAMAVFVFEKALSSSESAKEISGKLAVSVRAIPSFTIEGKAEIKMTEKEKKETEKFKCQFYGDYALDKTPTTFEDAIRLYQKLPGMMGKNKEKAVPMYAYLLPLSQLDNKAAKIVRAISNEAVAQTSSALNNLEEIRVQCQDALDAADSVKVYGAALFHRSKKELKEILSLLRRYKSQFQRKVSDILPRIRGGGAVEKELLNLFEEKARSPFSKSQLNTLVKLKKQKIELLNEILAPMPNTTLITPTSLQSEILDTKSTFIFTLVVRMFGYDSFLKTLDNYLKTSKSKQMNFTFEKIKQPWYVGKNEIIYKMRRNIAAFMKVKRLHSNNKNIKFLVLEKALSEEEKGTFLHVYSPLHPKGKRITVPHWLDDEQAKPESNKNQTHSIISLRWSSPDSGLESVRSYKIYYTKWSNRLTELRNWRTKKTKKGSRLVDICDLSRDTKYAFVLEVECIFGACFRSQISGPITTKPGTGLVPLKHCKWIEEKLWRKEADTCKILEAADLKPVTDRIKRVEESTISGQRQGRIICILLY